jgi:micrococcal nuclease
MYTYRARLVRVVDGDTVDLEVDLGFHCSIRERFRLEGIDTPERGQEGFKEATAHLEYLLDDGDIYITSTKQGSFRRWLGKIWIDDGGDHGDAIGLDVNQQMIKDGHAEIYTR